MVLRACAAFVIVAFAAACPGRLAIAEGEREGEGGGGGGEGEPGEGEGGEGEGSVAVVPHTFAPPVGPVDDDACPASPRPCPAFTPQPQRATPDFVVRDGDVILTEVSRRGLVAFDPDSLAPVAAVREHEGGGFFVRGDTGILITGGPAIEEDGSLSTLPFVNFESDTAATVRILDLHDAANPRRVASAAVPGSLTLAQLATGFAESAYLTGDELDVIQYFVPLPDGTRGQGFTRFRIDASAPGCLVREGSGAVGGELNIPYFDESLTQIGFLDFSDATHATLDRFRLTDFAPLAPAATLTGDSNSLFVVATDADLWMHTADGTLTTFNDDGGVAASLALAVDAVVPYGADLVVLARSTATTGGTDVDVISDHAIARTANVSGTTNPSNLGVRRAALVGDTALFIVDVTNGHDLVAFDLVTMVETGREPVSAQFLFTDAAGNAFVVGNAVGESTSVTPVLDPSTAALGTPFTVGGPEFHSVVGDGAVTIARTLQGDITSSTGATTTFAIPVADAALLGDSVVFASTSPAGYTVAPLSSVTDLAPAGVVTPLTLLTTDAPTTAPAVLGSDFYAFDQNTLRSSAGANVSFLPPPGTKLAVLGNRLAIEEPAALFFVDTSDPAAPVVGPQVNAHGALGPAFGIGDVVVFDDNRTLAFVDANGTRTEHGAISGTLVDATAGPVAWTFDSGTLHSTAGSSVTLPADATTPVAVADGLAFAAGNTLGLVRLDATGAHDGGTLSLPGLPTVVGSAPGFLAIEIGDSTIAVVAVTASGIDVSTFAAGPLHLVRAFFADDAAWFVGANEGLTRMPLTCH